MSAKKKKVPGNKDGILRIPVTLTKDDQPFALALKHAVERKEGRDVTWAFVVRRAFRALAKVEGVKCD